jgi:imidazoleglycerol phosphate dehydratase HisB
MPDSDLLRVFRALAQAAARFEKVAAKHHRIEAERKALQEALTDAQLVLSLQQRKPLAEVRSLKPSKKLDASEIGRRGKARGKPKG